MRVFTVFLIGASIGALTPALAMEPPPTTTQISQPAPEPAASESPASASTQSASAPSAAAERTDAPTPSDQAPKLVLTAADADAQSQLKRLKAAGYKPEAHGGEIWFCRREAVVGTRLEKKICNTSDQLLHIEADSREATDHIQRRISGDPIDPSIIGKVGGLCCGHRP